MRIIAGQHRGRRLLPPVGRQTTRPITDRVKTALFDRLASADRLEGAVVLDLFAGTGSLGLECLSRGAAHVTFIERDREALRRLRRNLRAIGQERQARALSRDILSPALPGELTEAETSGRPVGSNRSAARNRSVGPFTLVFADPPYPLIEDPGRAQRLYEQFGALVESGAVAGDAWLFLRTPKRAEAPELAGWLGPDSRTHGSMTLHRYRTPPAADRDTLSAP